MPQQCLVFSVSNFQIGNEIYSDKLWQSELYCYMSDWTLRDLADELIFRVSNNLSDLRRSDDKIDFLVFYCT